MPKLRPVSKTNTTTKNVAPQRPKSALLPSGPLKPLQPLAEPSSTGVKQTKTSDKTMHPGYEYVVGPPKEDPTAIVEDVYAVPQKAHAIEKAKNESADKQQQNNLSAFSAAIDEDIYQVPGTVSDYVVH